VFGVPLATPTPVIAPNFVELPKSLSLFVYVNFMHLRELATRQTS
jgi:hypothetical protein